MHPQHQRSQQVTRSWLNYGHKRAQCLVAHHIQHWKLQHDRPHHILPRKQFQGHMHVVLRWYLVIGEEQQRFYVPQIQHNRVPGWNGSKFLRWADVWNRREVLLAAWLIPWSSLSRSWMDSLINCWISDNGFGVRPVSADIPVDAMVFRVIYCSISAT